MSRLAGTFARIRTEGRPGLVTFTTAGDPDLPRSAEILKALDRAGADVIEVGVPFSDPLADGPVSAARRSCSAVPLQMRLAIRNTPCRPPHSMKVQLAPCHSPPSSMVMKRLRVRRARPFRLPPRGT